MIQEASKEDREYVKHTPPTISGYFLNMQRYLWELSSYVLVVAILPSGNTVLTKHPLKRK